MSWLEKANKNNWYGAALGVVETGREQGLTSIEEYNTLFEQAEKSALEQSIAYSNAERERKAADAKYYSYAEYVKRRDAGEYEEHPDNIDNSDVPPPAPQPSQPFIDDVSE
jgi:hypothetical protein